MSKEDAMKQIMDLIDEKAEKRKELREGTRKDMTYVQEVLKFLSNLDQLTAEAQNEIDFYVGMERECEMLKRRLKNFDPYVSALVHWNDTNNWKELQPISVQIKWSGHYLNLHPQVDPEEYIDVSRILLDDYE